MSYGGGGGGSSRISTSADVALNSPASGDVLTYNTSLSKWQNQPTASTVGKSFQTASYTLALSDVGTVVEMSSSSAVTLTVPPSSSVAWVVGTVIEVLQAGTGQVTVTPGSGVTINTPASMQTRTQWSSIGLRYRATDKWVLTGDLV